MRRLLIVVVILGAAAGAAAATFALRDRAFRGEALPGTRLLGTDLAGERVTPERVSALVGPRFRAPVVVVAKGRRLSLRPGRVLLVDSRATAADALERRGAAFRLLSPVPPVRDVRPVFRLRPRTWRSFLQAVDGLGRPARSALVRLEGTTPLVRPSRTGTAVDRRALLAALIRHVETGHSVIHAVYRSARPAIGDAAAHEAAAAARRMLAAPVQLELEGKLHGALSPPQLARLLRFRPAGGRYVVGFDGTSAARLLRPRLGPYLRRAQNARFSVSGDLVRVVPSQDGVDVDPQAVAGSLSAAAYSRDVRVAELALHALAPDLTTADANALGIRRKLVSFTTEMGESSSNRIHNVHLMADFIDGTIIRPGEVFSFNDVVGPRTAERGFLEGQMIVGSLVLPSIGGGVCQTATTLFNDAFEVGLPIVERHNHNLFLSHYPFGRDATVSWGGPDLKFRNDLRNAILIKTSYTDSTLTFTFYGTPQGRRVESSAGPRYGVTSPKMSYAIDPEAAPGSAHVESGSGASGFSVRVSRTVYEGGRVLRRDTFTSTYVPEGPTTVYGPGAHPPGPYYVLPTATD